MEASSARDRETKVDPNPTRMHPYSIAAGPPFNKASWKVRAKASQETSTMNPKLTMEERGMNLYKYLLADTVKSFQQDLPREFVTRSTVVCRELR